MPKVTRSHRKFTPKGHAYNVARAKAADLAKTRRNARRVRGELQPISPSRSRSNRSSMGSLTSKMGKMKLGSL